MSRGTQAPCPGTCNSGWRRLKALYDKALEEYPRALEEHARKVQGLKDGDPVPDPPAPPAPPENGPWYGAPVWCGRCQSVIRTELSRLDDLAGHLFALPPGVRPAVSSPRERVRVSGSHGTPSPSPGGDSLLELGGWLREWEAVAKREDDPRPRRDFLAREMTTVTAWLYAHFELLILRADIAADFGAEVRGWHRELTAATHSAAAAKHVKQPCPRCRRYTLWEQAGEEYLRCINEDCNRRLTRAELDTAAAS